MRVKESKSGSGVLPMKIALIDDDPDFRRLMSVCGKSMGFDIDTYASLEEMGSFARLDNYDLALVDYYLEKLHGVEIAEYIDIFFPELPVILVSGDDLAPRSRTLWPRCIKKFLVKGLGPYAIFNRAKQLLEDRYNWAILEVRDQIQNQA